MGTPVQRYPLRKSPFPCIHPYLGVYATSNRKTLCEIAGINPVPAMVYARICQHAGSLEGRFCVNCFWNPSYVRQHTEPARGKLGVNCMVLEVLDNRLIHWSQASRHRHFGMLPPSKSKAHGWCIV